MMQYFLSLSQKFRQWYVYYSLLEDHPCPIKYIGHDRKLIEEVKTMQKRSDARWHMSGMTNLVKFFQPFLYYGFNS